MKKFKVGISFLLLVVACVFLGKVALLLNYFSALALHELAHLFVASKKGYKLKHIKLDLFGLSVNLDEKIDDTDAFAINIAGPLCNLLVCVFCLAVYWLFPISYNYLNLFCFANLSLAMFNLLPIYPLDGGKVFKGIFKTEKSYKKFDVILKSVFIGLFALVFLFSLESNPNWFCLLFIVFISLSFNKTTPTFSLMKQDKKKQFEKVVMLKIKPESTLIEMLKKVKSGQYTIFVFKTDNYHYVHEEDAINLALNHKLTTKICDINLK